MFLLFVVKDLLDDVQCILAPICAESNFNSYVCEGQHAHGSVLKLESC